MRLTGVPAGARTRVPPELLGAGEGAVHVIDREVGDESGIRTVRAGLADPACRLAAVVAGQRVGLVEDIDRPAEQVLVEASCSRGVGSGDVEPGGPVRVV